MDNASEIARATTDAAERGLEVEFIAREGGPQAGPPADGRVAGVPIAKTVVVQVKDGFVFVVAPLSAQFSWPKLRAALGVNRLSLPDAEVAFAATGYRRGTISPLGSSTGWPVFIDETLEGQIALGSGSHHFAAIVDAAAFRAAYGATAVDLG